MFGVGLTACALALATHGARAQEYLGMELDFQDAQMQRDPFESPDFTLPLTGEPGDGNIAAFFNTIENTPTLATLPDQISQARFELEPCALVAPHVHPRGTEMLFVYEGSVTLGWSEENGGRVFENNITVGNSGFVPQGLVNWVQNNNCEPAKYVSTFPNNDFGVASLVPTIFTLPDTVLRGTFAALSPEQLSALKDAVASGATSADPQCLARCGMSSGGGSMGGGDDSDGGDGTAMSPSGSPAGRSGKMHKGKGHNN